MTLQDKISWETKKILNKTTVGHKSSKSLDTNTNINANGELLILVLGTSGSGKTSFINAASGSNLTVGEHLAPCTLDVDTSEPFDVNGHQVRLIDTPDFEDICIADVEVTFKINMFLTKTFRRRKADGAIYMHPISQNRVGNHSSKNFLMVKKMLEEREGHKTAIVTMGWDSLETVVGDKREKELKEGRTYLGAALQAGSIYSRYNRGANPHEILQRIVPLKPGRIDFDKGPNFKDSITLAALPHLRNSYLQSNSAIPLFVNRPIPRDDGTPGISNAIKERNQTNKSLTYPLQPSSQFFDTSTPRYYPSVLDMQSSVITEGNEVESPDEYISTKKPSSERHSAVNHSDEETSKEGRTMCASMTSDEGTSVRDQPSLGVPISESRTEKPSVDIPQSSGEHDSEESQTRRQSSVMVRPRFSEVRDETPSMILVKNGDELLEELRALRQEIKAIRGEFKAQRKEDARWREILKLLLPWAMRTQRMPRTKS